MECEEVEEESEKVGREETQEVGETADSKKLRVSNVPPGSTPRIPVLANMMQ